MEAFDRLVQKGKVRCLGGSSYDTWRFSEANMIANAKGLTPYTAMQQRFFLMRESISGGFFAYRSRKCFWGRGPYAYL